MRYINVDKTLKRLPNDLPYKASVKRVLIQAPTEEVVSKDLFEQYKYERDVAIDQLQSYGVELGAKKELVEVRHGEWINIAFTQKFKCSLCGQEIYFGKDKYCNECGAQMDGGKQK